jgi:hypothetical protein
MTFTIVKIVGGLCFLGGEYVLIIDSKATIQDKIRTFAEALRHFGLDQIYVKRALREILDKLPEQRPFSNSPNAH